MRSINNYYTLYIESVLALAKTTVIKLSDLAQAINIGVMTRFPAHPIDLTDMTSWKYYRNISGLYHPTDTVMAVVSLDDLSTITFNKSNLSAHPQTKKAYEHGSSYYNDLVSRYPDNETLILGILYAPEDVSFLQYACDADTGTILYYPSKYVEDTESSLMLKMQERVSAYCRKWINEGYSIVDNLYPALQYTQLSLYLVPAIISTRLSLCKTSQVHSYHIKQYLASNGQLDVHLNYLTRSQALFLYRNLAYIRNNVGRAEVFDWLVDNIMTARNLPLYAYTVKHDTYVQLPDTQNPDRLSLTPGITLKRAAINFKSSDVLKLDIDLPRLQTKLDDAAPGNALVRVHKDADQLQKFQLAKSNVTLTKVVESNAVDWSEDRLYRLEDFLFSQWMSTAHDGKYVTNLNPIINGVQIASTFSVKDMMVLYQCCMNRLMQSSDDRIHPVTVSHCLRRTKPTLGEIQSQYWSQYLSQSDITLLLSKIPTQVNVYNVSDFYTAVDQLYTGVLAQYKNYNYWKQIDRSTAGKMLSLLCFEDRVIDLAPGKTYTQWLGEKNLDLSEMTPAQYLELATNIFDQVTGYSQFKSMSIKDVQKAMLAVLSRLSAYSTLFIDDVSYLPVTTSGNELIKIYPYPAIDHSDDTVEIPVMDSTTVLTYSADEHTLVLQGVCPSGVATSAGDEPLLYEHLSAYSTDGVGSDLSDMYNRSMTVCSSDEDILAGYNSLSDSEKIVLSGIY